jgi:hypothetical protein
MASPNLTKTITFLEETENLSLALMVNQSPQDKDHMAQLPVQTEPFTDLMVNHFLDPMVKHHLKPSLTLMANRCVMRTAIFLDLMANHS